MKLAQDYQSYKGYYSLDDYPTIQIYSSSHFTSGRRKVCADLAANRFSGTLTPSSRQTAIFYQFFLQFHSAYI